MISYGKLPATGPLELIGEHTVRKTYSTSHKDTFVFIESLCRHLMRKPDPLIVPVYSFKKLDREFSSWAKYKYQYDMMRCGALSKAEKEIVDAVGDAVSRRYSNPTQIFGWESTVDPFAARKQFPKLMDFLDEVVDLNRYHDLHSGNVMKDINENYVCIDLEGFNNVPIDRSSNNWISREP